MAERTGHQLIALEASIEPDRVILSANVHQSSVLDFLKAAGEFPIRREMPSINSIAEVELTEAESFFNSHNVTAADIYYERVNRKYWDGLTDEQKYRVKTGLAKVAMSQGRSADAGSLLLGAKPYQPHAERARVNEALGYELLDKKQQAHELAESLIASFPHSPHLISCWIRTAPSEKTIGELEKNVSAITERDAQVNMALAIRCFDAKQYKESETFSRKAVAANPDWPGPNSLLAQSLLQQQIQLFKPLARIEQVRNLANREILEEIISVLNETIALAEHQNSQHVYADCYVFRAMANAFIGNVASADSDYLYSLKFLSDNSAVHFHYATFLGQHDRPEEAISQLRQSLDISPGAEATLILAEALELRNRPDDLKEASSLLERLATTSDQNLTSSMPSTPRDQLISLRADAFNFLIDFYLKSNSTEEVRSFISRIPEGRFSKLSILTANSKIEFAMSNLADASKLAEEALRQIIDSTLKADLRAFALHLMKLERHKDALPLWQKLCGRNGNSSDFRSLIRSAERVKQFGLVLETCKTAKECGFYDELFLQEELRVLEMFDIERAVLLLEDRLVELPSDKIAKTLLARLGLILRRESLVTTDPELLVGVDEATPPTGAIVVEILRHFGDPNDAVRYAYELVRRHYDVPIACQALVISVMTYQSRPPVFPSCETVGPGMAVRYTEKSDSSRWVVIEDSPNPNLSLREFSVSHSIAVSLMGKSVGQEFLIAQTSGKDRIGLIHEIVPKYIYRTRDICENWQERFPHINFVQIFHIAKDGSTLEGEPLDLTEMKLVAYNRHDQIKESEKFLKDHIVTFRNVARGLGCSTYEAFIHAALNPKLPVRSNAGRVKEQEAGLQSLTGEPTIVLDITAIASIGLLGLNELLSKWPGKFVISQDTASSLHEITEDAEGSAKYVGFFRKSEDGYAFQTETPENSRSRADSTHSFVRSFFDNCEIRSCPDMAYMDPELRDKLSEGMGKDVVESMLLARAPGHVLWTEDFVTGEVAAHEFAVRRVWSQLIIEHGFTQKIISNDLFLEATAKLFGYHFEMSWLNHLIIWKAGQMSKWNFRSSPLKQTLEVFENDGFDISQSLFMASVTIIGFYRRIKSEETRKNVIVQIFEHFLMREYGREALTHLSFALSQIFPKEYFARSEVARILREWTAEVAERPWITRPPQTNPDPC